MKLPGISYTTTPERLQGPSIQAPLSEANARAAATKAMTDVATGAINKYVAQETKAQEDKFALELSKRMTEYNRVEGDKLNYPINELPSDMQEKFVSEGLGLYDTVPKHRVWPEMYNAESLRNIEELSSVISSPGARRRVVGQAKQTAQNQYNKLSGQAVRQQNIYNAATQIVDINEAVANKNYGIALELTDRADMSETEKNQTRKNIRTKIETDVYSEQIADGDVPEMTKSLERIRSEGYRTEGGELDSDKQRTWAEALRRAISVNTSNAEAGLSAAEKIEVYNAQQLLQANNNGFIGSPEEYNQAVKRMAQLGKPVLAQQLWEAQNESTTKSLFLGFTPNVRQAYLSELRAASSEDRLAFQRYKRFESANAEAMRRQNEDSILYGVETLHMSLPFLDYRNLGESLNQRVVFAKNVKDRIGTYTGMLTKPEAQEFANRINNMGEQEKIDAAISIAAGLGEQAPAFYSQLKKEGLTGTFVVAGSIAGQGDRITAEAILRGQTTRKLNQKVYSISQPDIRAQVTEDFGKAYGYDPVQRSLMTEAVFDVYASLSVDGEYDIKTAEKAINMVTGGFLEYNGSIIEPPIRGMTQDTFDDYVRDINPKYLGEFENYSPNEVKERIIDGELKFVNRGPNQYYLIDVASGGALKAKGEIKAYVFRYDPNPDFTEDMKPATTPIETSLEVLRKSLRGTKSMKPFHFAPAKKKPTPTGVAESLVKFDEAIDKKIEQDISF